MEEDYKCQTYVADEENTQVISFDTEEFDISELETYELFTAPQSGMYFLFPDRIIRVD